MTRALARASCLLCAAAVLVPAAARGDLTGQQIAQAYLKAVGYLRANGGAAWLNEAGQPVLLGEGVAADVLVAGPRSTTLLAALELVSVDARGRRARTLTPLGHDALADLDALYETVLLPRPRPLTLANKTHRSALGGPKFGEDGTRVPHVLDNALLIQTLGYAASPIDPAIQSAIAHLIEFQIPSGADAGGWGVREYDADAEAELLVSAEAVRALAPFAGVTLTISIDPLLSINPDIDPALAAGVTFLKAAAPATADQRAAVLLALLEADPTATEVGTALEQLVGLQLPDGSFEASAYATALAAQAILRASEQAPFQFDSDGDSLLDGPDPDLDGDQFCDPGEWHPAHCGSTVPDLFPYDPQEHADLDNDGIGDTADLDDDGDGVPDIDEQGYGANTQEAGDADSDGLGDTVDPDDDNDGLSDVLELLNGLDPRDDDTDNDDYDDRVEVALGTDGRDSGDYPIPDGDIFPLGDGDGIVDVRDLLLALQILRGDATPPSLQTDEGLRFLWHGDVGPLIAGLPDPDGFFDAADVVVLLRRIRGDIAPWE